VSHDFHCLEPRHGWVPQGYVGPVALPGTGRMVFWTGRIAIGLRYAPPERVQH
jgi:hypothetical protein